MKKLILATLLLYASAISAQKANLIVEGISPNLYLTHIVSPKENYYSIGRLYNQAPKTIASFNRTSLERGLAVGQTLKIPLTSMNFDLSGSNNSDETVVPLYHVVSKNETLFRIGNNHASPLEDIRKWNNLPSDVIEIGTPLIVGYLKVKNEHLTAFNNIPANTLSQTISTAVPGQSNTADPNANVASIKEERVIEPATTAAVAIKQIDVVSQQDTTVNETLVAEAKPVTATSTSTNTVENKQPLATEAKAGSDEIKVAEIKPAPVTTETNSSTVQEEVKPASVAETTKPSTVAEETKQVPATAEAGSTEVVTQTANNSVSSMSATNNVNEAFVPLADEGVFGSLYGKDVEEKSLVNKAGEAGTFKSTSGWQDKKYYVLINDVTPGTVVKVSTLDNKTIYAKVLGGLPETKDSRNMLIRLSSAAASYLGIIDPKFPVQVSYYQ